MEHPELSRQSSSDYLAVVESPANVLTRWRAVMAFLLVFFCVLFGAVAQAESRLGEFLAQVAPAEVFPGADGYGAVQDGELPIAQVFKGQDAVGYVYLTTDIVNTRGYSSKPSRQSTAVESLLSTRCLKTLFFNSPYSHTRMAVMMKQHMALISTTKAI